VLESPESEFVARFTGTENVFEAVGDGDSVRVGDCTLRIDSRVETAANVIACIRPSRVRLRADDPSTGARDGVNALDGTVDHWLNEGTEYRVVVDVEGIPEPIVAAVHPTAFESLSASVGSTLRVEIPRSAIHVIERPDSAD